MTGRRGGTLTQTIVTEIHIAKWMGCFFNCAEGSRFAGSSPAPVTKKPREEGGEDPCQIKI